jgi:photosystem II stability/assembly factor-like uncharacterized protein
VGDPVNGKFALITTQNGGKSWEAIPHSALPPAIDGEGAFAASGTCITVEGKDNIWFATGGKVARVYRSTDNGKSWTVADTPVVHGTDSSGIFSIAFRDATHGVIAGGDYKQPGRDGPNLALTEDGGVTWKLSKVSPQAFFSSVGFTSGTDRMLAVGSAFTLDIGKNGARKIAGVNPNAFSMNAAGDAVAVGPKGAIVTLKK